VKSEFAGASLNSTFATGSGQLQVRPVSYAPESGIQIISGPLTGPCRLMAVSETLILAPKPEPRIIRYVP